MNDLQQLITNIHWQADLLKQKTDQELNSKVVDLKKRSLHESLDTILAEWFALVQEISFRTVGLKHFDTQLKAGWFLHHGNIVEMKTGEGKTLASTLPVSLNALTQKGVHVVTVNDYLAERDQKWMGKIYNALGLTSGLVKSTSTFEQKKESYASDITYLTNSELAFDYLRDSTVLNADEIVQRPLSYCVLDEIDSILIDEARTPLILSMSDGAVNRLKLILAKEIADTLDRDQDFQIDEKQKEISLTPFAYEKLEQKLGKKTLYEVNDSWILEIINALKAKYIFKLNKDYIILDGQVVIVDEFTGRIMKDRRWSLGIHEAIEIKENALVGDLTKTKTSITYQNFFMLYPKLCGMTGTAKTTQVEFQDFYQLDVVVLETNRPLIRKDLPDYIYQTSLAKWKAVLKQAKICYAKGQPILIGTSDVEKSEFLSSLFEMAKIPYQVLNAKPENLIRENEIVAQAGEAFAVTIATNMAGRGTDIILGGNLIFQIKEKIMELCSFPQKAPQGYKQLLYDVFDEYQNISFSYSLLEKDLNNLPYSLETCPLSLKFLYDAIYKDRLGEWQQQNFFVKELGGLFVLGTERHETRRIDNQLRGRSGRQGDPGSSQFFVSLEDDLMKIFGGSNIQKWVEYLLDDKDEELQSDILTKSIENAQQKVESYNYDIRKNVFDYDSILNRQRKKFFEARYQILAGNLYNPLCLVCTELLFNSSKEKFYLNSSKFLDVYNLYKTSSDNSFLTPYLNLWAWFDLRFAQLNFYQSSFLKQNQAQIFLIMLDQNWTQHLERMSSIRETINWRSYGQQKPLDEYNLEASYSFSQMFQNIFTSMLYFSLDSSILI